jgi:hypothetical protein
VYELYATVQGNFPYVTRGKRGMDGMTPMNIGDTWKYGITTEDNVYGRSSNSRYSTSSKFYQYPTGINYRVIFRGNKLQAQFVEHMMIMNYFFIHGALPPGNRVPW